MGRVKDYLTMQAENACEMCRNLVDSYNEKFDKVNELSEDPEMPKQMDMKLACAKITAKEILSQAYEHCWMIETDGDNYVVETDGLEDDNYIFHIDFIDKLSLSYELREGGGGYL